MKPDRCLRERKKERGIEEESRGPTLNQYVHI